MTEQILEAADVARRPFQAPWHAEVFASPLPCTEPDNSAG